MDNRLFLSFERSESGPQTIGQPSLSTDSRLFLEVVARLRKAHGIMECFLRGGSMEPAIPAGSRIRISFVNPQSYSTGQVIAFRVENRMCVHRIVYCPRWGFASGYLITGGDCCRLPDIPVKTESVLGTVSEFECEGTWQQPGASKRRDPVPRLIWLVVLALLIGASEININFGRWLVLKLQRVEWLSAGIARRLGFRGTYRVG